jgi:3-isopropylmalate dehydrogenase
MPTIALLPGDGIGPEVAAAAVQVLNAVADDLTFDEHPAGGAAIDLHGTALTDEALAAVKASDAVLLGALGGPKWDTNEPGAVRPEQGLFKLRAELGLFANLRPVRPLRALYDASPLKRELIEGVDMLIVRELTGGLYYGERGRSTRPTCSTPAGCGARSSRASTPRSSRTSSSSTCSSTPPRCA